MEKDYTVFVENRLPDGTTRVDVYPFADYTWHESQSLKQLLYEFESLIGRLEGTLDKEKWSEETKAEYAKIRKRTLHAYNNVRRLPQTLRFKGVPCCNMSAGEYIASFIDRT